MKISNSSSVINFKGYDAVPIKNIYLEKHHSHSFREEIEGIAQNENFSPIYISDGVKWGQDKKTIIEKNSKPCVLLANGLTDCVVDKNRKSFNMDLEQTTNYLTGGNCFLGLKENGEKWLMVGVDDLKNKNIDEVAELYEVKKENIFPLPQQNYHLDMYLRPIGYPYVLVNDPNLVEETTLKHFKDDDKASKNFRLQILNYNRFLNGCYSNVDETVKELKKFGFTPIRVAGDWGGVVNFINAIVNKKPDGTISYITNSSKCSTKPYSELEKLFEEEIKTKAPQIGKTYFIQGGNEIPELNYMMSNIYYHGGGIHCMSVEEPNFVKIV